MTPLPTEQLCCRLSRYPRSSWAFRTKNRAPDRAQRSGATPSRPNLRSSELKWPDFGRWAPKQVGAQKGGTPIAVSRRNPAAGSGATKACAQDEVTIVGAMLKYKDCMPNKDTTVALLERENTGPSAPSRSKKVGFVSLGCPRNLVDSEVMMGMLAQAGAQLTPRAEGADVIVVNTCSFIESAQQESVNTILEMAAHKTSGRAKKLVVAGCLVERFRDEISKWIPEVDAVVGTGELQNILAATGIGPAPAQNNSPFVVLTSRAEGDARAAQGRFSRGQWDGAIADLPNYLYDDETPRILATPKSTAYVKIAEGCDHPCTFCIIPQLRGQFRSRRFESVVAEAERLARSGVREITL